MTDDQIRELVKTHTDEIEDKLAEATEMVRALVARTDQGFTRLEGRLDKLERKLSIINDRLLSQEADIRALQEKG
jgi:tetrahydromethanopterin S-methyltransferase subunit G